VQRFIEDLRLLEGTTIVLTTHDMDDAERLCDSEATNILQGVLLLVSGIYYPVSVLPKWIQPVSWLSPVTYALSACRKLMGIDTFVPGRPLHGAPLLAVMPDLLRLLVMGVILIPVGLWIFGRVEHWAKKTGKLKRTG
jgi:ABC-2 type transport system permease protein